MGIGSKNKIKAKLFIDLRMDRSKYSKRKTIEFLREKREEWSSRLDSLSSINIFDLTDKQLDKKRYLEELIRYSTKVIFSENKPLSDKEIQRRKKVKFREDRLNKILN